MTDAPVPEFTVRYEPTIAAGFTDAPYGVARQCIGPDGEFIASTVAVLDGLTREQVTYLVYSLARAADLNGLVSIIESDQRWRDLRDALNRHRDHEGVEVEVHDARRAPDPVMGGWTDVRTFLPEAYR